MIREEEAIQAMVDILSISKEDLPLEERVAAMDSLVIDSGISKPTLVTRAERIIREDHTKKLQVSTGHESTAGAPQIAREYITMESEPFVDQAVVIVDKDGNIPAPPSAKPGMAYLVARVPLDVAVNVQPSAIRANDVRRKLMIVEALYLLGDPKPAVPAPASKAKRTPPKKKD